MCCYPPLRDREAAAAGRKDSKMKNVVISEKWDKKAARWAMESPPLVFDGSVLPTRSFNAATPHSQPPPHFCLVCFFRYAAGTLPYPFDSAESYERSLRQPLGREFNPDSGL